MYCGRCGNSMPDGASFCPQCGAPVLTTPSVVQLGVPDGLATEAGRQGPTRGRKGITTLGLAFLMLALVLLFEVLGVFISFAVPLGMELCSTVMGALGAMVAIVILGGRRLLLPTTESMRVTLRSGWWVIAVSGGLVVYDLVAAIVEGEFALVSDWPLSVLGLFVLCAGIGIAEEGMFRGLLLGGLLDVAGRTRRGIMTAAVISSVAFGLAHVEWWSLDLMDPLALLQALLKAIQTGTYGFYLAALVLSTGNIVGGVVLHALDDFLLLVTTVGLMGYGTEIEYVSTGDDAIANVVLYVVVIALYAPLVWQGIKLLRQVDPPMLGAFHKDAEAA